MPRRSSFGSNRVRNRSQRRETSWGLGPGGTAAVPISASATQFLGSVILPNDLGLTIIRMRGEFLAHLSLATGSGDGFSGAFGVGIATAAATGVGIGSVPTPVADVADENWIYHRFFSCKSPVAFAAGAAQGGPDIPSSFRLEVDSKAMRKFPVGMALYAAIEVFEVGTATINFQFDSRLLLKLS